ncbi:MAG: transposase family protein [Chloroflexi bacterium]|nr:transposase family protein [Chloroflexota bacterium]
MDRFRQAKPSRPKRFLDLDNGTPPHDTFGRVSAALDPERLQACFTGY